MGSFQNIWKPENFHFQHRLKSRSKEYFEGWYYKLVAADEQQSYAIIPGVFLGAEAHAFVQVLDGSAGKSWYHRFTLEDFRAARDRFDVHIGDNHFHAQGFSLNLDRSDVKHQQRVTGSIQVGAWTRWPTSRLSPGAMGPFSFVPFMECNHGLLSLDHELQGSLTVDGRETDFSGGRGYMEKDWGRSFPSAYVWTQSNHFAQPGISVTASVARIPWLTGDFRGYLVGFLYAGVVHRFMTYTGAVIEELAVSETKVKLSIRNKSHRLQIEAHKGQGALLMAPYQKQMLERVAEVMDSTVELRFSTLEDQEIFAGTGRQACLEIQGDLDLILN